MKLLVRKSVYDRIMMSLEGEELGRLRERLLSILSGYGDVPRVSELVGEMKKSLLDPAYESVILKARAGLVARRVTATNRKTGRTYQTTVWVKPDRQNGLKRYTEQDSAGARAAIARLRKEIASCGTAEELMRLVLRNRGRFSDERGRPLPVVKELRELVDRKNRELDRKGTVKQLSENIDTILNGTPDEKDKLRQTFFKLADTSPELKQAGLKGERFIVRYGVISHHKGKDSDHDFSAEEWKEICRKINSPILVTKYGDGFNLYLDVLKNGKNTLIGVEVKSAGKNLFINNVKTAFAKKIKEDDGIVLDRRNEKSGKPAMSDGDQSPTYSDSTADSTVPPKSDSVKGIEEKLLLW